MYQKDIKRKNKAGGSILSDDKGKILLLPQERGSPLCSSLEQGGCKRVLEAFFQKSDHTVACRLGANGEKV